MISAGSIVSYVGKWRIPFSMSQADVVSGVTTQLANAGLIVRDVNVDVPSLGTQIISAATFSREDVTVHMDIQLASDYDSLDTIQAYIETAVQYVTGTGDAVLSSSFPSIQTPSGTAQPTGQPSPSGAPGETGGGLLGSLTTDAAWAIGLIALGIILVVALERR